MVTLHTAAFGFYIVAEIGVEIDWLFKRSGEWTQECRARVGAIAFQSLRYLAQMTIIALLTYITVKTCQPSPES